MERDEYYYSNEKDKIEMLIQQYHIKQVKEGLTEYEQAQLEDMHNRLAEIKNRLKS